MIITLPEEDDTQFDLQLLIRHILIEERRRYIIQGQQNVSLQEHTKDKSLDYWLRSNVARYPDRKQATNELIHRICNSGLFRENVNLVCPNTGYVCSGIELV
jgi:hypothetical protein